MNISGQCEDGTVITTRQLCYIAEGIDCLFLSRQACMELGIIGEDFPSIGSCTKNNLKIANISLPATPSEPQPAERPCSCPARTLPPPVPTSLPFQQLRKIERKLKLGLRRLMQALHSTNAVINPSPSLNHLLLSSCMWMNLPNLLLFISQSQYLCTG